MAINPVSLPEACEAVGVNPRRFLRWRDRVNRAEPAVKAPGPGKKKLFDLVQFKVDVALLRHARKRSKGATGLYRKYAESISRRDLAKLLAAHRRQLADKRNGVMRRLRWQVPMTVWAIDATDLGRDQEGRRLYTVNTIDLASRYHFEPLVKLDLKAQDVAAHLEQLIAVYGRPLLLKRDNGSIFKCQAVDAVLARHGIIPLDSPAYYPKYNGAIENSIRYFKDELRRYMALPHRWCVSQARAYAIQSALTLNLKQRKVLNKKTALEVHINTLPRPWTDNDRSEIFDWISNATLAIMAKQQMVTKQSTASAWRLAVQTWLQDNNLVTITINQRVSPQLTRFFN